MATNLKKNYSKDMFDVRRRLVAQTDGLTPGFALHLVITALQCVS